MNEYIYKKIRFGDFFRYLKSINNDYASFTRHSMNGYRGYMYQLKYPLTENQRVFLEKLGECKINQTNNIIWIRGNN